MKPRNKKQEQILAMSGQLRPLTTAQMQWALTHTIDNYALRFKKGKAVCLICGHEWEAEEGMCRCPHCGAKVEVKATTLRVVRERSYFNIITAVKDFQVIRMFLMIVEFRKGMKANPGFVEIGSYWIDKHGHTTVVGLQRTLGHYIDSFAFGSPLEIRQSNEAFYHIAGQWVYPHVRVTEIIKRNGFKNYPYFIHPVTLFKQLLTNPKAETLMKSGDMELLRHLCRNPLEVDKYWDTIKVAKRAGYKVKDSQMWFDYIRMLDRMGKDLHSPTLVAPKDLKAVHDEYVAKVERQRIKEQKEKDRQQAIKDQKEFEKLKSPYFGLEMTDGEIQIHTLDTIDEYYEVGKSQRLCVASSKYYLKSNSLVFVAVISNRVVATIEVSLENYAILQCRAFANGVCEYQNRIAKIISDNIKMIAERKTA